MVNSHDLLVSMTEEALRTVTQHQLSELGITEAPERLSSEARLQLALANQGFGREWVAGNPLLTARGHAHNLIRDHNLPERRP